MKSQITNLIEKYKKEIIDLNNDSKDPWRNRMPGTDCSGIREANDATVEKLEEVIEDLEELLDSE